ncbi:MAG: metallophosphoesterase [Methanofastidiosum sp.]
MDINSLEVQLVINDLHVPYQDNELLSLVLKFAKNLKPDKLFILGDFMDFYSISRFDRDPSRVLKLENEFDAGREILGWIRETVKGDIYFLAGNHEDRLRKFLWNNPVLHGCINIEDKLNFKNFDIRYYEYGKNFVYKDKLVYTHGNKINKYSAYTAKNLLDDLGMSVISAHTHRLGMHYKTDYSGAKVGVENGCLCEFENAMQWFRREIIDWQRGVSVIKWHEDRFNIQQLCIPKDLFIIYGKNYYELDKIS